MFGALFGHFPNLVTIRGDRHRDALRYVETLDRLLALDAEMLLVGHFDPVVGRDAIRAELLRMRGAVLYVHDAVVDAMNAGKDVYTAMREIRLPPELEVGRGLRQGRLVRARDLGDLPGLVPRALDDGALRGAPGERAPRARRARRRPGRGGGARRCAARRRQPVEALHLAEAALAADAAPSRRARARAWPRTARCWPRARTSGRRAGSRTRSAKLERALAERA